MAHSIGKTIAELRKAKGWTQIELAEKLQVSDKTISKWEKDGGAPSVEFFPLLADIFGVTIDYLMMGDSIKKVSIIKTESATLENNADYKETIKNFLYSDIISIDELLSTNNYNLINEALNECFIHIVEKLNLLYLSGEWKKLFEFAIDNNNNPLADAIIKKNSKAIEKNILSYLSDSKLPSLNINKKHLFIVVNSRELEILPPNIGVRGINRPDTLHEAILLFKECRTRILEELSLRLDKEKTIGDLTKEFFEEELVKGNFDTAIIKLCVRLESILKNDFRYEGTFAEMLERYCNEKLHWTGDDGWGYPTDECDSKTINLLNKLRLRRNNIVHAEQNHIELTIEELKYCIDYICKMG